MMTFVGDFLPQDLLPKRFSAGAINREKGELKWTAGLFGARAGTASALARFGGRRGRRSGVGRRLRFDFGGWNGGLNEDLVFPNDGRRGAGARDFGLPFDVGRFAP